MSMLEEESELGYRRSKKDGKDTDKLWLDIVSKSILGAILHPIEYVKTLIQLGYEPYEPVPSTTILGRPVLRLPGATTYMGYIRSVDGIFGLYRGVSANIAGSMVYTSVYFYVSVRMPPVPTFEEDQNVASEEEKVQHFLMRQSQETAARVVATVAVFPLRLVGIRMMAQFIGGESKYHSILGSIKETVREEGFFALWNGLAPTVVAEVVRIWLAGSVAFAINNYLVEDPTIRRYITATSNFIVTSLVYPFNLVATVMAVTGAPIAAGNPPHLARYSDWVQCWKHLKGLKLLRRGNSLFWRYHPHTETSPSGIIFKIPVDVSNLD